LLGYILCSGRHALKDRLTEVHSNLTHTNTRIAIFVGDTNVLLSFVHFQLGYQLDDEQLSTIFWRFKTVAEQKKVVAFGYCVFPRKPNLRFQFQIKASQPF